MYSSNMQIVRIYQKCCNMTRKGEQCKRNGTKYHKGKHYCWMHHRQVDETYKKQEVNLYRIDSKNDDCSICYNALNDPENIVMTNCKHFYHMTCLKKWSDSQALQGSNSTCPMCRKRLTLYRGSRKMKIIMTNMDVVVKIGSI